MERKPIDPRPHATHVVLANDLQDAWNAAKEHDITPDDWYYPRTVTEAESRVAGVLVEAPQFSRRTDAVADAFRAATAHLARVDGEPVGAGV